MKTSAMVLALAVALSGSLASRANPYHVHHTYRSQNAARHHVARNAVQHPAPAAEQPSERMESPPPSALNQMFKPYAHAGDGDDDGMSRDPDDCMKGCIGGNPQ